MREMGAGGGALASSGEARERGASQSVDPWGRSDSEAAAEDGREARDVFLEALGRMQRRRGVGQEIRGVIGRKTFTVSRPLPLSSFPFFFHTPLSLLFHLPPNASPPPPNLCKSQN